MRDALHQLYYSLLGAIRAWHSKMCQQSNLRIFGFNRFKQLFPISVKESRYFMFVVCNSDPTILISCVRYWHDDEDFLLYILPGVNLHT